MPLFNIISTLHVKIFNCRSFWQSVLRADLNKFICFSSIKKKLGLYSRTKYIAKRDYCQLISHILVFFKFPSWSFDFGIYFNCTSLWDSLVSLPLVYLALCEVVMPKLCTLVKNKNLLDIFIHWFSLSIFLLWVPVSRSHDGHQNDTEICFSPNCNRTL